MNKTSISQNRAHGLDILKCLCAFLVVCLHSPFPTFIGELVTNFARVSVPVFFMITGYFWQNTIEKKREKAQILKILKLVALSNVLYLLFNMAFNGLRGFINDGFVGAISNIKSLVTFSELIQFILFNESPFGDHLWYLSAILYVLLIAYFLNRINKIKVLYYLVVPLLLFDLIFGKYSLLIFGREFDVYLVRNFLFVGLPYFAIGILLSRKPPHRVLRNNGFLFSGLSISIVASIAERTVLVSNDLNAQRDHYFFTTISAIFIFLLFLQNFVEINSSVLRHLSTIGRKYSLSVYIIHPILITVIGAITKLVHLDEIYSFVAPIVIFITAIIVSVIYYRCKVLFLKKFFNK